MQNIRFVMYATCNAIFTFKIGDAISHLKPYADQGVREANELLKTILDTPSTAPSVEVTGVSPAAINQFEKGEKKHSSGVLARISEELGVSTDYLLGATDDDDIFLSDNVVAAFRDFKELSKPDRDSNRIL